ncbi:hypothetical protein C9374_011420 [Naegleria lovaniensis]|uniref:RRM domain-containing protein n=1 Tax=Naegleria lovaniensis TaxID=51637 RepID=A0AA88KWP7_NAELO|nr:uncharacterized protein C9374_011420 [Naegleria lovaniensis]KAG2392695.1 hypothetical protein C9374_011420 [Naegleria lovaniensis]
MSKTNRNPSRCVFIGNIAYDAPLEKLKQLFNEAGTVVNFRMVYDRETNKPKGYAFCEFGDETSAMAAMKNLDGRDFNGRKLRVDFADNNKINMPGEGEAPISSSGNIGGGSTITSGPMMTNVGMGMPPRNDPRLGNQMVDMNPSMMMSTPMMTVPSSGSYDILQDISQDPVMDALKQIPKQQLYECLLEMKELVQTNPDLARQILAQNPTLAVVILHIQYILEMINQPFVPMVMQQPNQMVMPSPQMQMQPPMGGMGMATDPRMNIDPRRPPPQPQQPSSSMPPNSEIQAILSGMTNEQKEQIMNLNEATILTLNSAQQTQIRMIREYLQAARRM